MGSTDHNHSEFEIVVDRSGGEKLGIDVSIDHGSALMRIDKIAKEGLITRWNAQSSRLRTVTIGDSIIAANGEHGCVEKMHDELELCKRVSIKFRRPHALHLDTMKELKITQNRLKVKEDKLQEIHKVMLANGRSEGGAISLPWMGENEPEHDAIVMGQLVEVRKMIETYVNADKIPRHKILETLSACNRKLGALNPGVGAANDAVTSLHNEMVSLKHRGPAHALMTTAAQKKVREELRKLKQRCELQTEQMQEVVLRQEKLQRDIDSIDSYSDRKSAKSAGCDPLLPAPVYESASGAMVKSAGLSGDFGSTLSPRSLEIPAPSKTETKTRSLGDTDERSLEIPLPSNTIPKTLSPRTAMSMASTTPSSTVSPHIANFMAMASTPVSPTRDSPQRVQIRDELSTSFGSLPGRALNLGQGSPISSTRKPGIPATGNLQPTKPAQRLQSQPAATVSTGPASQPSAARVTDSSTVVRLSSQTQSTRSDVHTLLAVPAPAFPEEQASPMVLGKQPASASSDRPASLKRVTSAEAVALGKSWSDRIKSRDLQDPKSQPERTRGSGFGSQAIRLTQQQSLYGRATEAPRANVPTRQPQVQQQKQIFASPRGSAWRQSTPTLAKPTSSESGMIAPAGNADPGYMRWKGRVGQAPDGRTIAGYSPDKVYY